MPELILDISMSLDGFVAGPNPSLDVGGHAFGRIWLRPVCPHG